MIITARGEHPTGFVKAMMCWPGIDAELCLTVQECESMIEMRSADNQQKLNCPSMSSITHILLQLV